jgi:hypothetical protein
MVINAKPADHGALLDGQLGETRRSGGNTRGGSDNEAFVGGKSQTTVSFKFVLDVIREASCIGSTFLGIWCRSGRREVINMQREEGSRVPILKGSEGRSK